MKVIFTGDLFLGGDLNKKIDKKFIKSPSFWNADKIIVNLESPLSTNIEKLDKGVLFADPSSAENLRLWNISAVNLANNHIQDKGVIGIFETFKALNNVSIPYFGAGSNADEAKKPFYINENLCIIGFCQYKAPTLNFIQVATDTDPGVNVLTYDNIDSILKTLPEKVSAILHFHWGQEHLWFTQPDIVQLAKKCLKHPKVKLIIGMHPHRIQGKVSIDKKNAYLCLGNFLFPNFYINKPTELTYPERKLGNVDVTYQYHRVNRLTYKKWKLKNRISYLVEFNTETNSSRMIPMVQDENEPIVSEIRGIPLFLVKLLFDFLTLTTKIPIIFYSPIHKTNSFLSKKKWNFINKIFWIKQNGVSRIFNRKNR